MEVYFCSNGVCGFVYGFIVVGGDNVCVLYYIVNMVFFQDGDLLLIDVGCLLEDYYNGDIICIFLVNGCFMVEQWEFYSVVLEVQEVVVVVVVFGGMVEVVYDIVL